MNLRSLRRGGGGGGGPSFKITGSYRLEGYDDNLEPWLNSMKINGDELGPKFRATKLKIMVREPSKHNKKWSLTHKEEEGDIKQRFTYSSNNVLQIRIVHATCLLLELQLPLKTELVGSISGDRSGLPMLKGKVEKKFGGQLNK